MRITMYHLYLYLYFCCTVNRVANSLPPHLLYYIILYYTILNLYYIVDYPTTVHSIVLVSIITTMILTLVLKRALSFLLLVWLLNNPLYHAIRKHQAVLRGQSTLLCAVPAVAIFGFAITMHTVTRAPTYTQSSYEGL
jgi:hypothetical protein